MNKFVKKGLALLLAIVMIVGFVPNLGIYADAVAEEVVPYNEGIRGEKVEGFSSAAKAFYADNGVSLASLLVLEGDSNVATTKDSALYQKLQTLMVEAQGENLTSYDDAKTLLAHTDCQGGSGAISGFYSGTQIGPAWDGGSTWNREHVWPQSKSLDGNADGGDDVKDIMMVRPETQSANSGRGNTAFGESSGYYNPEDKFNNSYDVRGDIARTILYGYVRWGNTQYMWGTAGVMESKEVLLKWVEEDPVDSWELGRNDVTQVVTNTRNVFVDYPELAFALFAEEVPAGMETPNGALVEAQNVTVTYSVNGSTSAIAAVEAKVGDKLTLPTAAAPTGYTFEGWLATALKETETKPTVLEAGKEYEVLGEVTLHAVFSKTTTTEVEGGAGGNTYEKYTGTLTEGDYIIVYDGAAMKAAVVSSRLSYSTVTVSNNKITNPADDIVWHIAPSGSYWTIYNEAQNKYAASTGAKNKAQLLASGTDDKSLWTASGSETYEFVNKANKAKNVNSNLRKNGTYGFATYATSTGGALTLYKASVGGGTVTTITYLTHTDCNHSATTDEVAKAATCTEPGYTAGKLCSACGAVMSGYVWQAPKGHNYVGVITAPTATEDGYTTYTCSKCDDEYIADIVPALGNNSYTVSFSVPQGMPPVESMEGWDTDITLPGAEAPADYTFLGWVEAEVEKDTTAPATIYKEGDAYTVSDDVTLYALYSYVVGGTGDSDYELKALADIKATDKVIITMTNASNAVYALTDGNGASKAPVATKITVADDKVTSTVADAIVWNIVKDGNNLTIHPNGTTDKWLYCTNDNNGVRVGIGGNKTFVVESTYGYLFNSGTSRYVGVYNNADWRCYTTTPTNNNIKAQTLKFYVQGEAGTTFYTTTCAAASCEHANAETVEAKAPTCTEAGYTAGVYCPDCEIYISGHEEIAATNHANKTTTTVPATCTEDGSVTVTCDDCGATVSTETLEATGHSFAEGTCTVCGETDPDYDPDQPDVGGDTDRYYIATIRSSGNYYYMTSNLGTASTKRYQAVDSGLTELPASISAAEAGYVFVLVANSDGTYTIYAEGVEGDNKYLGWTSGNSGTLVAEAAALKLTKDENKDGTVSFHFTADAERYLALNGTSGNNYFAWYKSGQKQNLVLIPVAAGGDAPECAHPNTRTDAATEPDCDSEGYTEGVYCLDCEKYISGHEVIKALGHKYEATVTPPTATEDGYTTHTCSVCGDSYQDTVVPAVGQTYTVTFWAPDYAYAPDAMTGNKTGITLPAMVAPAGYSFAGWTTARTAATTEAPTVYAAGTNYSVTEETTLYALFTYAVGDTTGTGVYELATSAAQLAAGKNVVIVSAPDEDVEGSFALSTNQKTSNRGGTEVTVNGNVVTLTEEVQVLTLKNGTQAGTLAFHTGVGYLYAASSSGNQLKTKAELDAKGSWNISINDGVASIVAVDTGVRGTMQFNPNNDSPLFACYESASQKALTIYVEATGGAVYYTTEYAVAKIGEETFSKVDEALAVATSADTVKLNCDAYVSVDLDVYCTLDINGYVLNSTTVVDATNNDSQLMDSVGTGAIAADQLVMMPGNEQLAIKDGNKVVFETVSVKQKLTANGEKTKISFYIDKLAADTKLDDAILAGEDVQVKITVYSDSLTGGYHSFVYSQELVNQYTADWDSKVFTCNISGLEELGEYTITAEIVSCGVTVQAYDVI